VQNQFNDYLKRRGTQLLAGQRGLVVDIARAAQDYCGRPAAGEWDAPGPREPSPSLQPGSLAAIVLAWLSEVAGADTQSYAPVIASALEYQLASYEYYEATVLDGLNQHLRCIMHALGLGLPRAPLTASTLSHVCGRTLRDWCKEEIEW
jgi:hypothetical protein